MKGLMIANPCSVQVFLAVVVDRQVLLTVDPCGVQLLMAIAVHM